MNETKLNFYRGPHGMGNVISVSYGSDRLILDFGAPFEPGNNIYDGTVKPRIRNKIKDALLLGKIPPVPGVFAEKDLQDLPLEPYEASNLNTAIFISHLHLDHMSETDKPAKEIPIYLHEDGVKLQNALHVIHDDPSGRYFHPFRYHETIKIGQIRITPYFSDHPCPGSSGFLIHTPDSTIFYTGDIRFHGCEAERAFHEIETLSKEKIDLLITDATMTSTSAMQSDRQPSRRKLEGCISEQDIYDDIFASLKDYDGLGIFNSYERDTGMLKRMKELAEKLGRTAVFEPAYAYVLKQLEGIIVPIVLPKQEKILTYIQEMKEHPIITARDIKTDPKRYLLQNSYRNILSLIDLEGIPGKYYQLFGEPLTEKDKGRQIQKNFLNRLHWEFITRSDLFSFSHAYPNHLAWLIETVHAGTVIAVHSSRPEELDPRSSRQIIPEEEREYVLQDGELML